MNKNCMQQQQRVFVVRSPNMVYLSRRLPRLHGQVHDHIEMDLARQTINNAYQIESKHTQHTAKQTYRINICHVQSIWTYIVWMLMPMAHAFAINNVYNVYMPNGMGYLLRQETALAATAVSTHRVQWKYLLHFAIVQCKLSANNSLICNSLFSRVVGHNAESYFRPS